jgi:glycosyltransferase involved in cell wall biosynthesis
MMKVLGLALYGPLAASTRYRLGQYVQGLAEYGIDLQIRHLLGDVYLRRTFNGKSKPWLAMVQAGWERLRDLRGQDDYDAMMLHCELFPLMPAWVERSLLRRPYVYDFDDAFYLKYRSGRLGWLQGGLGNKFDSVIQSAAVVTAGNRVLQDYAQVRNPCTSLLPTVVDTTRYVPLRRSRGRELVVGWIGSPSTAQYLSELIAPLSTLGKEGAVRLVVIGAQAPPIAGIAVEERAWSEATEIELINGFDIGVMPLPDDEWARGKCAFKLVQYMACGVPVVASPVGANVDVVGTRCGLLAGNEGEWLQALRFLRDQPARAAEMGEEGRERVVQDYSLHRNLPVLAEALTTAAGQR